MNAGSVRRTAITIVGVLYVATWAFCIPSFRPELKQALAERRLRLWYDSPGGRELFGNQTIQQALDQLLPQTSLDVRWAIPVAPGIVFTSYYLGQPKAHVGVGECGLVLWAGTFTRVLWVWETSTS